MIFNIAGKNLLSTDSHSRSSQSESGRRLGCGGSEKGGYSVGKTSSSVRLVQRKQQRSADACQRPRDQRSESLSDRLRLPGHYTSSVGTSPRTLLVSLRGRVCVCVCVFGWWDVWKPETWKTRRMSTKKAVRKEETPQHENTKIKVWPQSEEVGGLSLTHPEGCVCVCV